MKRQPKLKTDREHARDVALNRLAEEFGEAMKSANLKYIAKAMTTLRMQDIWGRYMMVAIEYGDME